MSSPLSPQPCSESSESTQATNIEVLDAMERLAIAQKAVEAAEAFRSKVLATRGRKRGGGPASKQKATAAYESALRRLEDCQAELATLTQKSTIQPTSDRDPAATIGDVAMDVDDNEDRQPEMPVAMVTPDANAEDVDIESTAQHGASSHDIDAEDDAVASTYDPNADDDRMVSIHDDDAEDDGMVKSM
ncbi:hypothetical protein H0H92_000287 [Tricholoma furcatifolium]|nr:hypothetical protein H0H92_000287 [Tricholoma furcatifolium]